MCLLFNLPFCLEFEPNSWEGTLGDFCAGIVDEIIVLESVFNLSLCLVLFAAHKVVKHR